MMRVVAGMVGSVPNMVGLVHGFPFDAGQFMNVRTRFIRVQLSCALSGRVAQGDVLPVPPRVQDSKRGSRGGRGVGGSRGSGMQRVGTYTAKERDLLAGRQTFPPALRKDVSALLTMRTHEPGRVE